VGKTTKSFCLKLGLLHFRVMFFEACRVRRAGSNTEIDEVDTY